MHSAFLYHATQQGLDMCIVNAGMLEVYDNIPKDRLELIEDVLLNRRTDATERLTDYAEKLAAEKTGDGKEKKPYRPGGSRTLPNVWNILLSRALPNLLTRIRRRLFRSWGPR